MSLPFIDGRGIRKRILPVAVFGLLALSAALSGPAHGREIVDMAGEGLPCRTPSPKCMAHPRP